MDMLEVRICVESCQNFTVSVDQNLGEIGIDRLVQSLVDLVVVQVRNFAEKREITQSCLPHVVSDLSVSTGFVAEIVARERQNLQTFLRRKRS